MFNFLKKKPNGTVVELKIKGMHCSSCAMNIDGVLEDTEGVIKAETSYAKLTTTVTYDPNKVDVQKLKSVIESLDYVVSSI